MFYQETETIVESTNSCTGGVTGINVLFMWALGSLFLLVSSVFIV